MDDELEKAKKQVVDGVYNAMMELMKNQAFEAGFIAGLNASMETMDKLVDDEQTRGMLGIEMERILKHAPKTIEEGMRRYGSKG